MRRSSRTDRARGLRLAVPAAAALITMGCAGPPEEADSPEEPTVQEAGPPEELTVLSTGVTADEGSGEALLTGTPAGTVADGTACLSVASEYLVSWPEGYTALADPLRLVDESGATVATEGDDVVLVGGTATAEESHIECGDVSAPEWRAGGVVSAE